MFAKPTLPICCWKSLGLFKLYNNMCKTTLRDKCGWGPSISRWIFSTPHEAQATSLLIPFQRLMRSMLNSVTSELTKTTDRQHRSFFVEHSGESDTTLQFSFDIYSILHWNKCIVLLLIWKIVLFIALFLSDSCGYFAGFFFLSTLP